MLPLKRAKGAREVGSGEFRRGGALSEASTGLNLISSISCAGCDGGIEYHILEPDVESDSKALYIC